MVLQQAFAPESNQISENYPLIAKKTAPTGGPFIPFSVFILQYAYSEIVYFVALSAVSQQKTFIPDMGGEVLFQMETGKNI